MRPRFAMAVSFCLGAAIGLVVLAFPALEDHAAAQEQPKADTPDGGVKPKAPVKPESLDQLIDDAVPNKPAPAPKPSDATPKPAASTTAAPAPRPAPRADKPQPTPVAVKAAAPQKVAPPTDDNDDSDEAAPPKPLVQVQKSNQQRVRGPYELGPLDCRVLDGAGIERILPARLIAGEEPDLLCRVTATQPANVLSSAHQITLSVFVGQRETYRQVRNVRMSAVGRRALVFVVPMDKIAAEEASEVQVTAHLSAPATPGGGRTVKFRVESED